MLVELLKSTAVLLWIRVLASIRLLNPLVAASNALRSFVLGRRNCGFAEQSPPDQLEDLDIIGQWSIDLLKIVGKFSDQLCDQPSAIRTLIPQFCPAKSAIYRQFGNQPQLSVRGIANGDWDDCLGQVSIDKGLQATRIVCSDKHLAVLTLCGKILLWDCETFEHVPAIEHGEFCSTLCFNSTGELLAPYGYRTTRIWNVAAGTELHMVNSISRSLALQMAFSASDTELVLGLDNRKVAICRYKESLEWDVINSGFLEEEEEGTYSNAPTSVAFSANTAFVAVAYRGSPLEVWDMAEKTRVNKCMRRVGYEDRAFPNWTGVKKVVWNPNVDTVLGIYTDRKVFKWNPFEEFEHQELDSEVDYCASGIQCSPDGAMFLLRAQDGSVRIYDYRRFLLMYTLSSEDTVTVTDFCFSRDSRRFYDLRGSFCNIWEPNALLRISYSGRRATELDTEAASLAIQTDPSESVAEMPVAITALAAARSGHAFCYGNEDGLVEVNTVSNLKAQRIGKTDGRGEVRFLTWSDDGNYMAYSDGGSITVKKVDLAQECKSSTFEHIMDLGLDLNGGEIIQIVLHPTGRFVLIVHARSVIVFDLKTNSVRAHLKSGTGQKWANHSIVIYRLLAFDINSVTIYTWDTLEIIGRSEIKKQATQEAGDEKPLSALHKAANPSQNNPPCLQFEDYVDELMMSRDCGYAIVSISRKGLFRKRWTEMLVVNLADLGGFQVIIPITIPQDIQRATERPLGIIGQDKVVFMDRNFWVRSWRIGRPSEQIRRHFCLPRDWASAEVLELCTVNADGIVLVPRKGENAVIESSLCDKGRTLMSRPSFG
jgi:WD40 repeat protein